MAKQTHPKQKKTNKISTVKKGRIVEEIAAAFHDYPNVEIKRNAFLKGKGNDKKGREINVLVTGELAGHTVQIAIECKNEKAPIGVEKMDGFIGKLKDVGIPYKHGIYVSASGYTEGATRRAKEEGINAFTLVGLTKEGLSAVLLEAFQAVVFLMAEISQLTIEYAESLSYAQNPYIFFSSSGLFYGFLHDFVWELWVRNKIPSSIDEHLIELDITPGMHQIVDGKLEPIKSISVKVRITGLVITIPGKAEQYLLVNPSDKTIDRGKVNVVFEASNSPYPVEAIHTEEELKALMRRPGVVKIENRVRLPRIRAEKCYWPPSERVRSLMQERVQALQSGKTPDQEIDISEIEGTDLSAIWEPVSQYHPGSYVIYGQSIRAEGETDQRSFRAVDQFQSDSVTNPDSFESLVSSADVLAEQATAKGGIESDRLFALAQVKYEAAFRLSPDSYWLMNNWARALCEQARTKTGKKSDTLFKKSLEKYKKAFHLNPEEGVILLNWGNALGIYAMTKAGDEADRLFQAAIEKYEAIPREAIYYGLVLTNWGGILIERGKRKTADEAVGQFVSATQKFKAASKNNPRLIDAIESWGYALYEQAKLASGEEKARLLDLAIEKYESAVRNESGA